MRKLLSLAFLSSSIALCSYFSLKSDTNIILRYILSVLAALFFVALIVILFLLRSKPLAPEIFHLPIVPVYGVSSRESGKQVFHRLDFGNESDKEDNFTLFIKKCLAPPGSPLIAIEDKHTGETDFAYLTRIFYSDDQVSTIKSSLNECGESIRGELSRILKVDLESVPNSLKTSH